MLRRKKSRPPIKRNPRMVPRQGDPTRVIRVGHNVGFFSDLYVELLSMPWAKLGLLIVWLYFLSNMFFALIYYFNSDGIANTHPGSIQDAFFFSIQTMATIGYGRMVPLNALVNIVVSVEALWGFSFFAVTTALLFAKFSQPTARVLFSEIAVMGPDNGVQHLMLRLANQRNNRIVNAKIEMALLRKERTKEGGEFRRFYDLGLVRSHVPIMRLTWTVMHPLDKHSPLYGVTPEQLKEMEAEIIVSMTGLDETLSQTIHTRHSYVADEIKCNSVFEDVLHRRDDGYIEVNYALFHSVHPIKDPDA